ncbi:MAG: 23S rRNA (adenine(2503)-C(2))-methyltransferase RlmN [Patescibacteria group bacterium]
MNILVLNSILASEPKYRLKQIKQAIFLDFISNWDSATTLSKNLRFKLNEVCPLDIDAKFFVSKNKNVVKALITLKDKKKIETVLMRHSDGRNTVCVSTQVGCALGCKFCATGQIGLQRNLSADEIIEQVLLFARYLKKENARVGNVVFMGMGEPFLNYDNLLLAIKVLNDKDGFNLGARKMSISTVGITEGIDKFAKENLQVNLAVSLHAPNQELRARLMPISKKYTLSKIMKSVENYVLKTNRQVMFEYLLIRGVNDSEEQAKELADIISNQLYVVNLIKYNPTGKFKPSIFEASEKFKRILLHNKIKVTERYEFGQDIKAACGQLIGKS